MTSATTTWFAVLAVGAGSYLFRSVPLLLRQVRPADARTARLMSHAGLASIAALVAGSVRRHAEVAGGGAGLAALAAVAVAAVLGARGRPFAIAVSGALGTYLLVASAVGHL